MFSGYLGRYGNAAIGSPLSLIAESSLLVYDDGDEMYYLTDTSGEYRPGLAVSAARAEPAQHAQAAVQGFCVHDWSLL